MSFWSLSVISSCFLSWLSVNAVFFLWLIRVSYRDFLACSNGAMSPLWMLNGFFLFINLFSHDLELFPLLIDSVCQLNHLSNVMRRPFLAICEQQRCRSACASVQSDQHICCSLPRQYNISSFYIQISSLYLASVAAQAGLRLTWSKTPKTGFLMTRLIFFPISLLNWARLWINCFYLWIRSERWMDKDCKLLINEPPHDKTNKVACVPRKDSGQPGHPPSQIRVFTVHSLGC